MQRYLLRFAYEGTRFLGSQKQVKRIPPHLWTEDYVFNDRKTVQGSLESFLIRLRPVNEPRVQLSSRTDRGVHALSTTAIVDLQRQADGIGNLTYFDPKLITAKLNDYFSISNINIR
jgi:tRNA U38,U39,U40 pseudouridine synthase TruA